MGSDQRREPAGGTPPDATDEIRELEGASRARDKLKQLWQPGDLFHVFSRYPRKPNVPRIDRLAGVLRKGIVAPASCEDGSVCSDLNLVVTGASVPYDSLVFLHRFGPQALMMRFMPRS